MLGWKTRRFGWLRVKEKSNSPTFWEAGHPGLLSLQHMVLERQKSAVQQLRVAESGLEQHSFWLEAWYADIINDEYVLLLEVKGPQEFSEQYLENFRGVLAMAADRPI